MFRRCKVTTISPNIQGYPRFLSVCGKSREYRVPCPTQSIKWMWQRGGLPHPCFGSRKIKDPLIRPVTVGFVSTSSSVSGRVQTRQKDYTSKQKRTPFVNFIVQTAHYSIIICNFAAKRLRNCSRSAIDASIIALA